MKNFLTHYQVTLTAQGPVFVGSGRDINKNEYLELSEPEDNKKKGKVSGKHMYHKSPKETVGMVGILNMEKLYDLVYQNKLRRQYEDFVLGLSNKDNIKPNKCPVDNIKEWLDRHTLLDEAEKKAIAYRLDGGDITRTGRKPMTLKACVKDHLGRPYIPGSSLKGMLRTILATQKILADNSVQRQFANEISGELPATKSRKNCLRSTAEKLEAKLFRTLTRPETRPNDAVNDILSGLVVSDSAPLSTSDLTLAQKIERRPDGTEKPLNIARESLRPGTKITFSLTIDQSLCPLTKEEILAAIAAFDEAYSDNFLLSFKGTDRLRPPQIYLGGGTGFVGKTLIYPLMGKKQGLDTVVQIFDNTGVPRNHKHHQDKQQGVSPHIVKCTHYKGATVQMGLCKVEIE